MHYYEFWSGFAAFIYGILIFPNVCDTLIEKRKFGILKPMSIMAIIGGVYFISIGAQILPGWTNPFAGRQAEVDRIANTPKEMFVVLLLMVWPLILMLVGAGAAFIGYKVWKRAAWASMTQS